MRPKISVVVGCVGWMCLRRSDLENAERVLSMNEIASPDLCTTHLPLISKQQNLLLATQSHDHDSMLAIRVAGHAGHLCL